jgi:hypothetical protein
VSRGKHFWVCIVMAWLDLVCMSVALKACIPSAALIFGLSAIMFVIGAVANYILVRRMK